MGSERLRQLADALQRYGDHDKYCAARPNYTGDKSRCSCGFTEASRLAQGIGVSALQQQEGGDHYKALRIQPVEYIYRNGIGFMEGNVIKYVTRWRSKGGVEDLRKARHFLDLLIQMEEGQHGK